jgi:hypothetical protein
MQIVGGADGLDWAAGVCICVCVWWICTLSMADGLDWAAGMRICVCICECMHAYIHVHIYIHTHTDRLLIYKAIRFNHRENFLQQHLHVGLASKSQDLIP